MKTFLLWCGAAVVLLVVVGFAVGWFSWTNHGDHSTLRVETSELNRATESAGKVGADVVEDIGDAVRYGGEKAEETGDELQRETSN
jgi:hypothetical protein